MRFDLFEATVRSYPGDSALLDNAETGVVIYGDDLPDPAAMADLARRCGAPSLTFVTQIAAPAHFVVRSFDADGDLFDLIGAPTWITAAFLHRFVGTPAQLVLTQSGRYSLRCGVMNDDVWLETPTWSLARGQTRRAHVTTRRRAVAEIADWTNSQDWRRWVRQTQRAWLDDATRAALCA